MGSRVLKSIKTGYPNSLNKKRKKNGTLKSKDLPTLYQIIMQEPNDFAYHFDRIEKSLQNRCTTSETPNMLIYHVVIHNAKHFCLVIVSVRPIRSVMEVGFFLIETDN